jgi:hypothetical protein
MAVSPSLTPRQCGIPTSRVRVRVCACVGVCVYVCMCVCVYVCVRQPDAQDNCPGESNGRQKDSDGDGKGDDCDGGVYAALAGGAPPPPPSPHEGGFPEQLGIIGDLAGHRDARVVMN